MTKQTINRFSILQTGKLLGVLYGFLALIFLPIMLIPVLIASGQGNARSAAPVLIMLLFYPVMGFIGGIIGAVIYNLSARLVGGIEIDLGPKIVYTAPSRIPDPQSENAEPRDQL